jgi:L-ribulose-5-phosphate 3-epimerase
VSLPTPTRRDLLKALGALPLAATTVGAQGGQGAGQGAGGRGGGRAPVSFPGAEVTPSPTAVPGGKPLLTLYSISLQWADYEEAAATAAAAGWPAIGWTVRQGGHVLPENVTRDLPRAVAAAKKAGLQVPIIITPVKDTEAAFTEPYLDTMSKLGLRYYQAPTLARYDYTKELQPQLDVWKAKIEKLAKLNEKYGTTAVFHVEGGAGNIGGGAWDLWLLIRDFDTKYVGMDFDLGHVVFKGGPGVWEAIRFMHKNVLSIASKDIRWARKSDPAQGPRRSDPSDDWPWAAEYVRPGTGMVNFKMAFEYMKAMNYCGSFLHYSEYFVDVPGNPQPLSLLRPNVPKEIPKDVYIASVRRDYEFFSKLLKDVGY